MSTAKKKIGISFSTTNFQYYWNWFTKEDLGDDLELILLSFQDDNTNDIATCNGFVLTGGVDVHPSFYKGNEDYPNAQEFQPQRDAFEQKIYEYAQQNRLPLLAICRGMQLVNVLNGGKLIQDLGVSNSIHRKDGSDDKLHQVNVKAGSILHEVTNEKHAQVNSAHHQSIHVDAIGNNLLATAHASEDHTIEALEFQDTKDKAFMLCVQWHPERMANQKSSFSKNIKQRFIKEVRNQK